MPPPPGSGPAADAPSGPTGLLLSRDLIFTARITSTAQGLGRRVLTAGSAAQAAELIERWRPPVVLVDLAAGDLARAETLAELRAKAPEAAFVAFGSHVDTDALAAASAAGCDPVMPRSRFVRELPDLILRYLPGP